MIRRIQSRLLVINALVVFLAFAICSAKPQANDPYNGPFRTRIYGTEGSGKIRVVILGAVENPGVHFVPENTDIVEFVQSAKPFSMKYSNFALLKEVKLFTMESGKETVVMFNIKALSAEKGRTNTKLKSGDVIYIPECAGF